MFEESGWVNRIITAGIIAMIGWTLLTVQDLSVNLAVMEAKFTSLETVITVGTQDRYTRIEATSDNALINQRIERLEDWNERLSDRLNKVEDTVSRSTPE